MLTVKQVAERLNISVQLVYSIIDSGNLVAHRYGLGRGTLRVSEEDLEVYQASCRQEKDDEPKKARRQKLKHVKV